MQHNAMNLAMNSVTNSVTIDQVEEEIAADSRYLRFSPAIETAFERETAAERVRNLILSAAVALALYDGFLINDWVTMRDVFPALAFARLCIFTPVLLILLVSVSPRWSAHLRESLSAAVAVLAVSLPTVIMVFSTSPHKLSYQYGSLLIMTFATVIQRQRFRYGGTATLTILVVQSVTTYLSGAFTVETYIANVVFFVTATILLLLAAYLLEHADRRSYLFALRGRLLQVELEKSACTDPLTGLWNRRHLGDVSQTLWAASAQAPRSVAVVMIDIDCFKAFNDSLGHIEGDLCLRRISACVSDAVGCTGGTAVRFGGEEILVLLPDADLDDARRLAETIRSAIAAAALPHPAVGADSVVTASFGIAAAIVPQIGLSELVSAADVALYAAKHAGRDCIWPLAGTRAAVGTSVAA